MSMGSCVTSASQSPRTAPPCTADATKSIWVLLEVMNLELKQDVLMQQHPERLDLEHQLGLAETQIADLTKDSLKPSP